MSLRVTSYSESLFTSLVQAQAAPGQEIRIDDIQAGDLYHGRAADGADTAAIVWEVARLYRDGTGTVIRIRYVSGVAWDQRTNAGLWS